ncbi:YceI family protein [Flavivirga spongiicola]|uniref:YceI family protein n=1 Tax=Flavivirga spongiicola TaxID=421621 RepID=A0ABU7XTF9_9FLAO|nr:YceI family protein [Flavivirga sp. MEBiC05379]MDO5978719.1 YceI family protein [Flavivirga sp. MEBiC05379]
MKKIILLVIIICFTSITNAQKNIEIDTTKSVVKWTGSNLFKYNKHFGTVKFISGHIIKSNDVILGGYFEIDMNSIANTDGKYNEMLVGHLKNQDFFDVEKHPRAIIKFIEVVHKNVNTIKVKANLTIKNVTNAIDFNIKFKVVDGKYEMNSKFIMDRTRWGVNYESKGMFGSVKDGIISDAIEFEVVLIFN